MMTIGTRVFSAGFALLLCLGSPSRAFETILDNGPSSNRVDIVFMGDGYTAADHQAGVFADHVNGYLDTMFANVINSDPFYRYRHYFNVHAIEVVSNESGADQPPNGIYVDTALDASYWYDGDTERLLYVDVGKANAVRDAALAGSGFTAEMQFVTVNDTKYGGGGGDYAVFSGGDAWAHEIALHELGHAFADLADEYGGYWWPYLGREPSEVNVTKSSSGQKWERWLGYDQPDIGVIGAYEGARYYDRNLYRPSLDSKMRNLGRPFDAVGREKIILEIYALVDPLDDWLGNSEKLIDPEHLYVERIDDDVIEVEWIVNGDTVDGAAGEVFDLRDYGYGEGEYSVSAVAYDPTAFDPVDGWVRMNESELMQTVTWTVTLSASSSIPGDANHDGSVDEDDAAILAAHWGQIDMTWETGDFDGDRKVGLKDASILAANWGYESGEATTAPEPGAVTLLIVGATVLFQRRRRQPVNFRVLSGTPELVPEPGSLILLLAGALVLGSTRFRNVIT
jgi:hypothetical protein